jgi:hypothetical protein
MSNRFPFPSSLVVVAVATASFLGCAQEPEASQTATAMLSSAAAGKSFER